MSRKALALAVAATLTVPATASAYEVVGKQLEIYGKVHVSADFVDNDTDSELALASNSSRLGFKGLTAINDNLDALYQIESKIVFDEGGTEFATRNTFVGLFGDFGKVLFGYQDTPLKNVRGTFDLFGDTVGDARNIMNEANFRARNSLQYVSPSFNGLSLAALYSTSYADSETDEGLEDNDTQMFSVGLGYELNGLELAAAYESADAELSANEIDAARIAASYGFGPFTVGAIYEQIDLGDDSRDAYGVNAAYKTGPTTFKVQYVAADEWDNIADSDGSQLTLGVDYKLAKHTTLYGAYNILENGDGTADYQIKGGHDTDVYSVAAAGDEISVFSVGLIHSF